ncbi:MAG: SDR family oxidoreductase [Candidatus Omnitrophica bacterium]|nr:SDR family oxidoreductase [Candidatus Omnitrophota bacterium]
MSSDYLNELFDLDGKVAVLFGGTGELVGTIAEGFGRAGMKVVLCGRSEEKANARIAQIQKNSPWAETLFCQGEVNNREDIQATLHQTLDRFGQVDVLVNGAGVNSPTPFLEISDEEFNRIIDTNLHAVVSACQIFGKHFLEEGRPAGIINITSISSNIPLSKVFTYSASKAALLNLTRNLGREWAKQGIRVNALTPGFFPAEQNKKILTPERTAQILGHTAAGRFGESEELIGAALLLASSKAGSFINGAEYIVDGGFSAMTI